MSSKAKTKCRKRGVENARLLYAVFSAVYYLVFHSVVRHVLIVTRNCLIQREHYHRVNIKGLVGTVVAPTV